jgi:DNA-binding SARP family transcriptional activator
VALAELVAARHASEQHDAPKALRSARTATDLLGGGLLPAHEADWLDAERERVADLRVEALELAARAAIRVGGAALPQAELDARRAVSEAPFRESARAALISVLAARGNSAEALRAYEDIRELLMEELGTVPGSELMTLHTSLLTGAPRREAPASPRRSATRLRQRCLTRRRNPRLISLPLGRSRLSNDTTNSAALPPRCRPSLVDTAAW